jgi:hypothetical protein
MRTIQQSRTAISAFATVLMVALSAPMAVAAEEQALAMAPTAPTWNETSGYGSLEMIRAESAHFLAPTLSTTWDVTSGYRSVEVNRVIAAQHALLSGDLGSVQEQAMADLVAASSTWDQASGYGAVEASRAATELIGSPSER